MRERDIDKFMLDSFKGHCFGDLPRIISNFQIDNQPTDFPSGWTNAEFELWSNVPSRGEREQMLVLFKRERVSRYMSYCDFVSLVKK